MSKQLLKTSGTDILSSGRKLRKPLAGGGWHPLPLYVRGLKYNLSIIIDYYRFLSIVANFVNR